jgi:hypothetical protein
MEQLAIAKLNPEIRIETARRKPSHLPRGRQTVSIRSAGFLAWGSSSDPPSRFRSG